MDAEYGFQLTCPVMEVHLILMHLMQEVENRIRLVKKIAFFY